MPNFEYRPRPDKDPLSEAVKHGWQYIDDLEDPIAEINNLAPLDRTPERAQQNRIDGEPASYVYGAGVVHDAAPDSEGNWLVLTSIKRVILSK